MNRTLITFIVCLSLISCQKQEEALLYISDKSGGFDIYLNDLKGSEKVLTDNPGWDWSPDWNYTLDLIIYNQIDSLEDFSLQAILVDGREVVFDFLGKEEFILSPRGGQVLFTKEVAGKQHIFLRDLETTKERDITPVSAYHGRPTWSWDGEKVGFISDRTGQNEVFVYNRISGKTKQITDFPGSKKYITWSPSNHTLAFTVQFYKDDKETHNDLYTVNINDLFVEKLTEDSYNDVEISWSPNGEYLAFHSNRDGGDHIYTLNMSDKTIRRITEGDAYYGEPEWILTD